MISREKKCIVMHMVDSLAAGGAERVTVNLCNQLARQPNYKVFICTTRCGGILEKNISEDVTVFKANKKHAFDIIALVGLYKMIKTENISILHAHSSSIFWSLLIGLFSRVKIIWHDHYGGPLNWRHWLFFFKWRISLFIAVNKKIALTHAKILNISQKKSLLLKNFAMSNTSLPTTYNIPKTQNKIICLANFRPQKDHLTLIQAFSRFYPSHTNWVLLLAGTIVDHKYYNQIKELVKQLELEEGILFLGRRDDTDALLKSCQIGVLSSAFEGLPLSLLEYGMAGLASIATAVGECQEVIIDREYGWLVPPKNATAITNSLIEAANNEEVRKHVGTNLYKRVSKHFSAESTIATLMKNYQFIIK